MSKANRTPSSSTLCRLLVRPGRTMATLVPSVRDAGLVVTGLILVTGLNAALRVARTAGPGRVWLALPGAALGILSAWNGLTTLFHVIARLLGSTGSYVGLLALMGYAATPMILTSLVSLAITILTPAAWPRPAGPQVPGVDTLLGWIGVSWGWPGLLSAYALHHRQHFSAARATIVVLATYVVMLAGCSPASRLVCLGTEPLLNCRKRRMRWRHEY